MFLVVMKALAGYTKIMQVMRCRLPMFELSAPQISRHGSIRTQAQLQTRGWLRHRLNAGMVLLAIQRPCEK